MVHGGEGSIGCLAITDEKVEEIYVMVEAALRKGQAAVPMHLLPFRLAPERLERESATRGMDFWQNLREGDARFEVAKRPPAVRVAGGRYELIDGRGPEPPDRVGPASRRVRRGQKPDDKPIVRNHVSGP